VCGLHEKLRVTDGGERMGKPTELSVDLENLQRVIAYVGILLREMDGHYKAIDQCLDELYSYWSDKDRMEFQLRVQQEREQKDARMSQALEFFEQALQEAPIDYSHLDYAISTQVQALVGSK